MATISIVSPCGVTYYWDSRDSHRGWFTAKELEPGQLCPSQEELDSRELEIESSDEE